MPTGAAPNAPMICVVIASLENGRGRVVRAQGVIVVGRDARSTVVLDERGVSGSHCRLSPMPELPGAYLLEDLASTYGTFVNSARVGRPVVVSGRDVVSVGGSLLMLAPPGEEQRAIATLSAMASPQPEPVAAPPPAAVAGTPQLGAFNAAAPWMQQFEHFDALARGWQDSGRPKGKLLRGPVVRIAEQWLAAGINQSPTPGALHRDFVEQSRNGRLFRLQMLVLFVVLGVLIVGGGVGAYVFRAELWELWNGSGEGPEPPPIDPIINGVESKPVELAALVDAVKAEPNSTRRLLLESSVAEVARSQGRSLLSDAAWELQRSAHGTLAQERETILRGHTAPISDVEFSPDGVRVASASEDGSARLWDFSAPSPGRVSTLRQHIGAVNVLAFSPDGSRLVTGGDGGKVWVWDAAAAEPAATGVLLQHHKARVLSLGWHPDGKHLVSGDEAGVLALWDVGAPTSPLSTRTAHDGAVTSLVFDAADPPSLWSGSEDRAVRQWTLRPDGSLARVRTLDDHLGSVTALAVSEDLRWAATGTSAGEVFLWPRATRRKRGKKKTTGALPPIPLVGHKGTVASVAFTPDGHWLITSGDTGLRMWDLRPKDPSVASVVLTGHTGEVTQMVLAAGNRAVTAATDTTLRVWDLEKSQTVISSSVLDGHIASVQAVAVSKDGLRVASGAEDHTVRVWDAFGASAGRGGAILRVGPTAVQDFGVSNSDHVLGLSTAAVKVWTLSDRGRWRMPTILEGSSGLLKAGAIDPDGSFAAVGSEDGQIYLWSLSEPDRAPTVLEGHTGPINGLSYLPDGRLVSISSDRSVRLWDVRTPEDVTEWTGHSDEVVEMAVSAAGDVVFTGGLDGMLLRWNVADGTSTPMPGHVGEILQIRVSPDGTRVASGSADRKAHVWNATTGKLLHEMRDHEEKVLSVAFGRSKKLATGGADGRVFVWDLTSEHPDEKPRVLLGHEQSVSALVFSRDLEVLVSGGNDTTVRLWRLDTGREVVLPGHDRVVTGLKLARDGAHVVSGGFDGTVRVWPLAHTSLIRTICDVVGESLPEGEAAAALGVPVEDPCL